VWELQASDGPLDLVRKTPEAESWQALKKGGMAGIYIVVMGLSWWIKAQQCERDTNVWAVVDDVSWVIRQMTNAPLSITSALQKRRHEHKGEGEEVDEPSQQKWRYVTL
jgi:hypothetical protein